MRHSTLGRLAARTRFKFSESDPYTFVTVRRGKNNTRYKVADSDTIITYTSDNNIHVIIQ